MNNLDNLLNIDKHPEVPIGDRFLNDLVMLANKAEEKHMDVTKKEIIDGLMIYYSRTNKSGAIRRMRRRRRA